MGGYSRRSQQWDLEGKVVSGVTEILSKGEARSLERASTSTCGGCGMLPSLNTVIHQGLEP